MLIKVKSCFKSKRYKFVRKLNRKICSNLNVVVIIYLHWKCHIYSMVVGMDAAAKIHPSLCLLITPSLCLPPMLNYLLILSMIILRVTSILGNKKETLYIYIYIHTFLISSQLNLFLFSWSTIRCTFELVDGPPARQENNHRSRAGLRPAESLWYLSQ